MRKLDPTTTVRKADIISCQQHRKLKSIAARIDRQLTRARSRASCSPNDIVERQRVWTLECELDEIVAEMLRSWRPRADHGGEAKDAEYAVYRHPNDGTWGQTETAQLQLIWDMPPDF